VINKFRGDVSLFEDGIRWLETKTGVKVVGVVPYIPDLKIEGEDSLSLASRFTHSVRKAIDIAVIKLPYVSNYTDLEPFLYEKDVSIRFVQHADELGTPDVVILPGTRSTTADLQFVKKRSLDQVIRQFIKNGGRVIGLCGGYQMLCERLLDPFGSDSGTPGLETDGLGLLPMVTSFLNEKKTVRSVGTLHPDSGFPALAVDGFEIHLGETTFRERAGYSPFLFCEDGSEEGCCSSDGRIIGTYFHHLFYNDGFRNQWLNEIRTEKGSAARHVYIKEQRDEAYDQLADHVSRFLDIDGVLKTIERWGT
jgi:adenosylcobyric acid synthase